MRIRNESCPRLFKDGDSVLSRNRREVFKKDFKRIAGFEVVEEGLDRYTRSCKDRRAAVDFWVDGDECGVHRVSAPVREG
jgi:hypothetical protein